MPVKVRLPHSLEKTEIRRRLEERKGEITNYFPEGMADMDSRWRGEDHMDFVVAIAGQRIQGAVDLAHDHVLIEVDLPFILSFLNGKVEDSVRKEGTRLLT